MVKTSFYQILGIAADAEFPEIRRAYRARAMDCHPDRHAGDVEKVEEFRQVVEAFNVLSDPVKRREYDHQLGTALAKATGEQPAYDMGASPEDEHAILDTKADDLLEELIVGNELRPHETTLATLMLDLEKTEQFCLFREAKTCLYDGATQSGERLFRQYLESVPCNILAHVFLARCCRANGKWRDAIRHLAKAMRIGESRVPPLKMLRLRRELERYRKKRPGLPGLLARLLVPETPRRSTLSTEEQEKRALNRAINRLALEREQRKRRLKE